VGGGARPPLLTRRTNSNVHSVNPAEWTFVVWAHIKHMHFPRAGTTARFAGNNVTKYRRWTYTLMTRLFKGSSFVFATS
jgi:hypothetical protein